MRGLAQLCFQESEFGAEGGRRDRKMDKEKKRRSGKLRMGGIWDLLRSLKNGHIEELRQLGNLNPGEVQSTQQCHHPHGCLPSIIIQVVNLTSVTRPLYIVLVVFFFSTLKAQGYERAIALKEIFSR
jgi:hypothetical protein